MHAIQEQNPGPGGSTGTVARGVPREAGVSDLWSRAVATGGEFLGVCEGGLELWLSGGHVYSHLPSGGRGSHVCRLAAPNRLLKQDRRRARHTRPPAA